MADRRYASGTTVTEARSHFDLQRLLKKHGCLESGYIEKEGSSSLMFAKDGVTYRFTIQVPTSEETVKVDDTYRPGRHGTKLEYERSRKMRALVAVVKAQLVAIDEGIADFGQMFVGKAVTDNGQTVEERWTPSIKSAALEGRYPSALPGGPQ